MDRKDFFNLVKDDYYNDNASTTLTNFCKMYESVTPVFGTLKTKIEKQEHNVTKVTLIDEDISDYCIDANGNRVDEAVDMSTISLIMYLNEDNIVIAIENKTPMFTNANKNLVLFYGGLIGKQILLDQ